ncbi:hypothetical protein ACWJKU_01380 [Methylocaldum sp. MU1018]
MSKTYEELRREAERLRKLAAKARENAAYADSAQARKLDEDTARGYERRAAELERQAEELEAGQNRNRGLYRKYIVQKADGAPVDPAAEYFVLRLDVNGKDPRHIRACRIAVLAYANEIEDHLPQLAEDLRTRYGCPFRRVEVIEWRDPNQPPDAEITVQLSLEGGSDPVWLGFWDGGCWRYIAGTRVDSDGARVLGWAHLPKGLANHG